MIMKSLVRQFFKWIIKTRHHAVWVTMLCKWLLKIVNFNKHTFRNKITKLHHWPKHANAHTLHHFAIRLWKFLFRRYLPKTKKLLEASPPGSQPTKVVVFLDFFLQHPLGALRKTARELCCSLNLRSSNERNFPVFRSVLWPSLVPIVWMWLCIHFPEGVYYVSWQHQAGRWGEEHDCHDFE